MWEIKEYSKMIYLDGHIQVFKNIDHLFELPKDHIYGVKDCFCKEEWSHTPQFKIGYCQQNPEKAIIQWPETLGPKPSLYFNTDMIIFEPSVVVYNGLLEILKVNNLQAFSDQDCINTYFKDNYTDLSNEYNLDLSMLWYHPEKVDLKDVKVVNYCVDGSQPWKYSKKEKNMNREDIKRLVRKWNIIDQGGLSGTQKSARFIHKMIKQVGLIAAAPVFGVLWCFYEAIDFGRNNLNVDNDD